MAMHPMTANEAAIDSGLQALTERIDKIDKRIDVVVSNHEEHIVSMGRRIERIREDNSDRWREFRREREEEQLWWVATGIKAAVVICVLLMGIAIGGAIESASQPEPAKVEALK